MADLEARVVRTIGDPDIRFREDPVRILRAVKFAARCDLTIEPETYRRMMEHRLEIAKCAQARVSEEFYRLLRAGAAKRSMELLLETELLEILAPELVRGLKADADSEEAALHRARFWGYLAALDRSSAVRPVPPSNALMLAVLVLPRLRDALDPDSNGVRDIGQMVSQVFMQAFDRLRPSRRDTEITRQILIALRNILPAKSGRRKGRPPSREFLDEALRLAEIVSQAEAAEAGLVGRPIIAEGVPPVSDAELEAEAEELAGTLEPAPSRSRTVTATATAIAIAIRVVAVVTVAAAWWWWATPRTQRSAAARASCAADGSPRARGGGEQPRHAVPSHVPRHRHLRRPLELARRLTLTRRTSTRSGSGLEPRRPRSRAAAADRSRTRRTRRPTAPGRSTSA